MTVQFKILSCDILNAAGGSNGGMARGTKRGMMMGNEMDWSRAHAGGEEARKKADNGID